MTNTEITQLIDNLASKSAANTITPAMVASIMAKLLEAIPENGSGGSSSGSSDYDYFFGSFATMNTSATVEQEFVADTCIAQKIGTCFHTNIKDDEQAIITADSNCLVEITGFVTLRATDTYSADRVLRWFKLDEDGERYATTSITVHFSGTTQIFSVPIAHSTFLKAGETLHLVHYSSSGSTNISGNSSIYIKATPTA